MTIAGWFKSEVSVEQVLADKPFANFITIIKIDAFFAKSAMSGRVFFIETDKGRFKLRACYDEKQAKEIESNLRKFQHIFPKFYGRDRNYILMEALQGYRNISDDELKENANKIGRIYGEITKAGELHTDNDEEFFTWRLNRIRKKGMIDEVFYRNVLAGFESSRKKIDVQIALDLNDVHSENFMINEKGEMLYVDEEGISYRMKGLGIGKVMKTLKRDTEWNAFLAGYNGVTDGSYLTPAYLHHIQLVEAVRSIHVKMDRPSEGQKGMSEDLERLKRLIEKN